MRVNDRRTLALLVLAANAKPALTIGLTGLLVLAGLLFATVATTVLFFHAYIGLPVWLIQAVAR